MTTNISLPFAKPVALGVSSPNFRSFQAMHSAQEVSSRNRVTSALNTQEEIFDEVRMPEDLRVGLRRAVGVSEWGSILGARNLIASNPLLGIRVASNVLNVASASVNLKISVRDIAEKVLREMYGSDVEDLGSLRDRVALAKSREAIHPVDLIFDELEASSSRPKSQAQGSADSFPNLVAFLRAQIKVASNVSEQETLNKAVVALNVIETDESLRELFQAIDQTFGNSEKGIEAHVVTVMRQLADLDLASGDKKEGLRLLQEGHPLVLGALVQAREHAAKTKDPEGQALKDFYDATLRRVTDTTQKTTREVAGGFKLEVDNDKAFGQRLLRRYNVNPANVFVVNASVHIDEHALHEIESNKELYIIKLLKAHEHSLKNRQLGTSYFSNRQYSTSMELELDQGASKTDFWTIAGNFEMSISELICGERGNMTVALNRAIDMLDKDVVDRLPEDVNIGDMLKVKRLAMSSSKPLGEDKSAWQPCSDCYGWMGAGRFFNLDTQILSFSSDAENNLTVEVRTLRDLLPREGTQAVSVTNEAIDSLPIEYSKEAIDVVRDIKLSDAVIRRMLKAAQKEYSTGTKVNEGFSGKEAAATVLFHESKRMFSGKRVEWVPRWPEPAALIAAAKGINELSKSGIEYPIVKAVAHYGDHEDIPSIKTNGRLAQKRGSKDVVHIVIEGNVIQVRTIKDYQPWVHGSVRQLSQNRETV